MELLKFEDTTIFTSPRVAAGAIAGGCLFLSGQVSNAADGSIVGLGNPELQARTIMENISRILDKVGLAPTDIAKLTCFIADPKYYKAYADAKHAYLGEHMPAGTAVVARPLDERFLFEIDVIAEFPKEK